MREIPLSQGKVAVIDDEDFALIRQFSWSAEKHRNTFYAVTNFNRRHVYMHNLIMRDSGKETAHEDGDGLNNRRSNLSKVTRQQNSFGIRKVKCGTSKYKGVSLAKDTAKVGIWCAYIHHNYKKIGLGRYTSEEDAALAYNEAAKKLFGKFAVLNETI
jgi:hypothetical protein